MSFFGSKLLLSGMALAATAVVATATAQPVGGMTSNPDATGKKICKQTTNPDGSRCTFCYYTTQPGSGRTVCVNLKTKEVSKS